jgi:hypothetical protein
MVLSTSKNTFAKAVVYRRRVVEANSSTVTSKSFFLPVKSPIPFLPRISTFFSAPLGWQLSATSSSLTFFSLQSLFESFSFNHVPDHPMRSERAHTLAGRHVRRRACRRASAPGFSGVFVPGFGSDLHQVFFVKSFAKSSVHRSSSLFSKLSLYVCHRVWSCC